MSQQKLFIQFLILFRLPISNYLTVVQMVKNKKAYFPLCYFQEQKKPLFTGKWFTYGF